MRQAEYLVTTPMEIVRYPHLLIPEMMPERQMKEM
ncbi:MAG: hypothetical protein QOF02_234, partial [Blastocatellia bacterium]|nr:hypothetical protein [Blastocatellia bacterium]